MEEHEKDKTKSKDIKKKEAKRDKEVLTASFQGLVDIVRTKGANLEFLLVEDEALVTKPYILDGTTRLVPPSKEHLPFHLPRYEEIVNHFEDGDSVALFRDTIKHLKQYSYLDEDYWVLLTCFVFLTYIQDNDSIEYFPTIYFWAVPERGKSRTGKSLTHIAYRGLHLIDVREAHIFRYSENLNATLFIDVMDFWRKAEKSGNVDIFLLRNEKGAKVCRIINTEKGAFKDTNHYKIDGATMIASNEPAHHIFETRCIPISMPNKPGDYSPIQPKDSLELKERLTAWRAKYMNATLPAVSTPVGLSGRFWNITKPLLQICTLVDPKHVGGLAHLLVKIAGEKKEDKRSSPEGRIVSIISDMTSDSLMDEHELFVKDILEEFNCDRDKRWHWSSPRMGKTLTALGFKARKSHGISVRKISQKELVQLMVQYGLTPDNNAPLSPNSPKLSTEGPDEGASDGEEHITPPDSPQDESSANTGLGDSGEFGELSQDTKWDDWKTK
ncbi:hypothetical protein ACFLZI_00760 [Nitrospirota bacterium]